METICCFFSLVFLFFFYSNLPTRFTTMLQQFPPQLIVIFHLFAHDFSTPTSNFFVQNIFFVLFLSPLSSRSYGLFYRFFFYFLSEHTVIITTDVTYCRLLIAYNVFSIISFSLSVKIRIRKPSKRLLLLFINGTKSGVTLSAWRGGRRALLHRSEFIFQFRDDYLRQSAEKRYGL